MTNAIEFLKDYAIALQRLEYDASKPGSKMTLGEYEAEEKRITAEYSQAIVTTYMSDRETELQDALNEVADKWAKAQIEVEDYAKRCMLLEVLVRDWRELYENPDYGDCLRLMKRMRELGIESGRANK